MSAARVALVVITALLFQVCLFARFSYEGAQPDVMILLAIAAGFVAGPEKGAVVGFASGLVFDVVLTTPFGLSAFVYTLIGYGVGVAGLSIVRSSWWIAPAVAAVASAAGMVVYALVGAVVGQATLSGPPLTAIVVVVASLNAVLAPVAVRAMRWARSPGADSRRQTFFAR